MTLRLILTLLLSFAYASQAIEPESPQLSAGSVAQLEEVKEQLKHMRGDIEQLQFDRDRVNENIAKLAADMEFRFGQLDKKKNEVAAVEPGLEPVRPQVDVAKPEDEIAVDLAKGKAGPKSVKQKAMEQEYQDAYATLKERDYAKARLLFQKFLSKYPDSDLAGSARYWNGETYFAQENYNKAAVEYLKGYQVNNRGSRAPDNLLKLSKSLAKSEKRKGEACVALMKLKKEFPGAQAAIKKQMNEDIKALKCK